MDGILLPEFKIPVSSNTNDITDACVKIDENKFKFMNRYVLLTYRTHLNKKNLIKWMVENHSATKCRVAHETGSSEVPYQHSHVFVDFGKQVCRTNCRTWDYDEIHPHIRPIRYQKHLERIFKYMCKEDHENDDMLTWTTKGDKLRFDVNEVWNCGTIQEALQGCDTPGEVMAAIQVYSFKLNEPPIIKRWEFMWQEKLAEELMADGLPPKRQIRWFVDLEGGKGKTDFVKGMMDRYSKEVCVFTQFGGARDAATNIVSALQSGWTGRICLVDLPRKAEDKAIYEPLEMIKNGLMTSLKYVGTTRRFQEPWVLVFANFYPDKFAMSWDRWDIYDM